MIVQHEGEPGVAFIRPCISHQSHLKNGVEFKLASD